MYLNSIYIHVHVNRHHILSSLGVNLGSHLTGHYLQYWLPIPLLLCIPYVTEAAGSECIVVEICNARFEGCVSRVEGVVSSVVGVSVEGVVLTVEGVVSSIVGVSVEGVVSSVVGVSVEGVVSTVVGVSVEGVVSG